MKLWHVTLACVLVWSGVIALIFVGGTRGWFP